MVFLHVARRLETRRLLEFITEEPMKVLALWTLLIAALLPLTACHWHHGHHRFADGYSWRDHAQNDINRFEAGDSSRGA